MKKLLVDFATFCTAGGFVSSPKDVPQTWWDKYFCLPAQAVANVIINGCDSVTLFR